MELSCGLQSNEYVVPLSPMNVAIHLIDEQIGVVLNEDIVIGITRDRPFDVLVLEQIQCRVRHGDERRVRRIL